jgi:hypothetical protein
VEFFRDSGATDYSPALKNFDAHPCAREVVGADQAIVATADNHGIESFVA